MGLFDRLTTLWAGDTATDQSTSQYRCTVCQATFESAESHTNAVACEECGAHKVRSVD